MIVILKRQIWDRAYDITDKTVLGLPEKKLDKLFTNQNNSKMNIKVDRSIGVSKGDKVVIYKEDNDVAYLEGVADEVFMSEGLRSVFLSINARQAMFPV